MFPCNTSVCTPVYSHMWHQQDYTLGTVCIDPASVCFSGYVVCYSSMVFGPWSPCYPSRFELQEPWRVCPWPASPHPLPPGAGVGQAWRGGSPCTEFSKCTLSTVNVYQTICFHLSSFFIDKMIAKFEIKILMLRLSLYFCFHEGDQRWLSFAHS